MKQMLTKYKKTVQNSTHIDEILSFISSGNKIARVHKKAYFSVSGTCFPIFAEDDTENVFK